MPTPSEIQTCIDNLDSSSQPIDFTVLAAETSQANTGISFSVATVEDLPTYSDVGLGQIFFVESIGVPVISTRSGWSGLDGRVLSGGGTQNALFTWGFNRSGKLGNGTTSDVSTPTREICFAADWCQVKAGQSHTLAIKSSGEIWAWGCGSNGRLGDGTTTDKCSPIREICSATDWCYVSAGAVHNAAIKTSGELWTWGSNYTCGRLGDGTTTSRCSPVREFCSATDWCQVGAGWAHTAAIKTSGELWVWGTNCCGALGDGTATNRCSPVREYCSATDWCQAAAGCRQITAVKTSGELWAWGFNSTGELGDGTITSKCSPVREYCSATDWCQVSVGSFHTAAIKTTGEIWGWGSGSRLGDGTTLCRCSPVREFCSATDWCQVSAGGSHTIALKTSSELWAWGNGNCGRLGTGTCTTQLSPVREYCSATDWCQAAAGEMHSTAIRVIT